MLKMNLQHFALRRPAPQGGQSAPVENAAPTPPQAPPVAPPAPPQAPQNAAPTPPPAPPQAPAAPPAPPQAPAAPQNTQVATTGQGGKPAMMDFHNQGGDVVLEGFDEWGSGNYVTVDGSDFYIKSTETRVRELTVVISYARQYYRWYDQDNKKWHEAPNKIDDRYSLACELKWYDWVDGEEEPKEFTMTISTTSAIQFREYVGKLRDGGIRVNGIWTRMGIDRLERIDPKTGEKQRYSRVNFNNAGAVQYD